MIYFKDKRAFELVSWNDLDIGDIFYHVWLHKTGLKLSKNYFYYFDDKSFSHWSKLNQEGHKKGYKNFMRCTYTLEVDNGQKEK